MTIPGAGFGPRGVRAAPGDFAAFVRTFAPLAQDSAPGVRFGLGGDRDRRGPLIWAISLLGAGAAGLALTALSSVTRGLGVSLSAWLAFGALVLSAALPWLEEANGGFDPHAIPDAILPRQA